MYPKQNRLPRDEFRRVFETGTRLHAYALTIVHSKNGLEDNRFAVIVGKSVHKHAVVRNRIKRLIRESLHHILPILIPGQDVVVIAKRDISDEKQSAVETEMKKLISRLHLLKNEEHT